MQLSPQALPSETDRVAGIVRYAGKTTFGDADWVGVVLDDCVGKHDGVVKGRRYFHCAPGHGIFVRAESLRLLELPESESTAISPVRRGAKPVIGWSTATKHELSPLASTYAPGDDSDASPAAARLRDINSSPSRSALGVSREITFDSTFRDLPTVNDLQSGIRCGVAKDDYAALLMRLEEAEEHRLELQRSLAQAHGKLRSKVLAQKGVADLYSQLNVAEQEKRDLQEALSSTWNSLLRARSQLASANTAYEWNHWEEPLRILALNEAKRASETYQQVGIPDRRVHFEAICAEGYEALSKGQNQRYQANEELAAMQSEVILFRECAEGSGLREVDLEARAQATEQRSHVEEEALAECRSELVSAAREVDRADMALKQECGIVNRREAEAIRLAASNAELLAEIEEKSGGADEAADKADPETQALGCAKGKRQLFRAASATRPNLGPERSGAETRSASKEPAAEDDGTHVTPWLSIGVPREEFDREAILATLRETQAEPPVVTSAAPAIVVHEKPTGTGTPGIHVLRSRVAKPVVYDDDDSSVSSATSFAVDESDDPDSVMTAQWRSHLQPEWKSTDHVDRLARQLSEIQSSHSEHFLDLSSYAEETRTEVHPTEGLATRIEELVQQLRWANGPSLQSVMAT